MSSTLSRRAFLASATSTGLAAGCAATKAKVNTARVVPGKLSPNGKLNIAAIGVGGMGKSNIDASSTENVVALCDVDDAYSAKTHAAYPNAKRHTDFRKMFDAMEKEIDAVIVATPDHNHAITAIAAMRHGKHVYCQKPLAHSLHEVRTLMETARACGVQTQMGNQGHSSEETRRLCEWIQDGAVGPVREVHAWSDRPVGGDPWSTFPVVRRPGDAPPVPPTLNWDLWLGPAKKRPYNPVYCPLTWRGWYDFGTGALGDMGCHILDPSFWALKLGHPTSVQATTTHWEKLVEQETFPRASIVRYEFPARGDMPPVNLTWYDGRLKPPIPRDFTSGESLGSNGVLLIGEKGTIMHGSHGAGNLTLLPKAHALEYKQPPKTLPRVTVGGSAHEQDWIRACKDGNPASSTFEYGGALTEMVLLGVLAMRLKDRRLQWDGAAFRFTNDEEANALVNPEYSNGWTL